MGADAAPEMEAELSAMAMTSVAADDTLADEVIESDEDWLEGGHEYAARKANEMTQWVDNFFGNDERDLEQAELPAAVTNYLQLGRTARQRGEVSARRKGQPAPDLQATRSGFPRRRHG